MKKIIFFFVPFLCMVSAALAQDSARPKAFEVYGFVMLDMGYDFKQINPNWFDALRVTRLPTYKDQYAPDGNTFFGVRQTRFGVRAWFPTSMGILKTQFEFDMFGVGVDEGQTTMRLRHAYGELGRVLVGQTESPFMDGDIWPNTAEYWGPTGMVFFRNVQIRYAVMQGKDELYVALERPGASADRGTFEGRIELDSVVGRFPYPDLSAHYKKTADWGHVQLAGMLRSIQWQDIHKSGNYNLSGSAIGWGLHLSTVVNLTKMDIFRGSFVYGEGVENYMNDAPVDIGIDVNPGNAYTPIKGKALPVSGYVAFLDHYWSKKLCTAIGFSGTHITNTPYGSATAYKDGQYGIVNLVYYPVPSAMAFLEFQYGKRSNYSDGFSSDIYKIQLSFKYNFSQIFYRDKEK